VRGLLGKHDAGDDGRSSPVADRPFRPAPVEEVDVHVHLQLHRLRVGHDGLGTGDLVEIGEENDVGVAHVGHRAERCIPLPPLALPVETLFGWEIDRQIANLVHPAAETGLLAQEVERLGVAALGHVPLDEHMNVDDGVEGRKADLEDVGLTAVGGRAPDHAA
jgi:hypothetical protein